MLENENATDSLTSRQIAILAGRTLGDLSGREKLAYANAAPRPVPFDRYPVAEEFRFRIDTDKAAVDPSRRLRIAIGAKQLERVRKVLSESRVALVTAESDNLGGSLREQIDRLTNEGAGYSPKSVLSSSNRIDCEDEARPLGRELISAPIAADSRRAE